MDISVHAALAYAGQPDPCHGGMLNCGCAAAAQHLCCWLHFSAAMMCNATSCRGCCLSVKVKTTPGDVELLHDGFSNRSLYCSLYTQVKNESPDHVRGCTCQQIQHPHPPGSPLPESLSVPLPSCTYLSSANRVFVWCYKNAYQYSWKYNVFLVCNAGTTATTACRISTNGPPHPGPPV